MSDTHAAATELKRTPLYERHRALGARLVEFGGWEMPVQYTGIIEEHHAVRQRAGLFDVCHMGEFRVEGPGALDFLQYLVPNDVSRLVENQALYTQICLPNGGTLDDLIIYRLGDERYMTVVNAGTIAKDWDWFSQHAAGRDGLTLTNVSDEMGLLALQGPLAGAILQPLTATPLDAIAYYHCQPGSVAGIDCIISRTGYTGEDGFELYCGAAQAGALWDALLAAGQPHGLLPAGLGARDTLRLEAGYCLYGHELSESTTPLEAGLGWTVKLNKDADFIGKQALADQKRDGLRQKLVGVTLRERGVPRGGYAIYLNGERIGELTSGTLCPTLERPAALGFVPPAHAAPGTEIAIEIRGKLVAAEIAPLPFYKRQK
ncbi:MAG: Aminomethyltransferase (glycine cleavage system T protein) [Ktedonobacterales bacterium]|jgi:aminomethyltransferase|nr:MAG: Aminomethyltransferase (glycine cleavage system T protein) [Ktedonobacterales bacterium]